MQTLASEYQSQFEKDHPSIELSLDPPPPMIDPGTQRVSYLRRLVTFALALGIIIATFDVLSKGEHFFVPLVMAVLAVYLVDILSRLIRKIPLAGHAVPSAISMD